MFLSEEEKSELQQVRMGDHVALRNCWSWSAVEVDRTTPKQIVIGNIRFWKKNGWQVGASSGSSGFGGIRIAPLNKKYQLLVDANSEERRRRATVKAILKEIKGVRDTGTLEQILVLIRREK